MEHLAKEDLSEILNRVNHWIENCDAKASIILGGIGAFAGILLATDNVSRFVSFLGRLWNNYSLLNVAYLLCILLSLVVLAVGIFLLIEVLFARVDPEEFKNRGVRGDSLIFFSSIAQNCTLSQYRGKLQNCSPEQMKEDFISQIYICSLICDKKFALYKKGFICSIIGLCSLILMMIIGLTMN